MTYLDTYSIDSGPQTRIPCALVVLLWAIMWEKVDFGAIFGHFGAISRPKGGLTPKLSAKMSFLALFRPRTTFHVLSGGPYRPSFALGRAPAGARRRRAPGVNMEKYHKMTLYGHVKVACHCGTYGVRMGMTPTMVTGTYGFIGDLDHHPER